LETTKKKKEIVAGGSFLVEQHPHMEMFTPEDFDDEALMMAESIDQFIQGEVVPRMDELEADPMKSLPLMKQIGELGLFATEVPEAYGGMDLPKANACLMLESGAIAGGFLVGVSAHVGIGTMPITFFGTKEQKEKYLPKLATGEWIGAYALTESSSGSDALNARTKAVLSEDGKHYLLNGTKMWITNGGFADVFTVFAKIDGEHFTAFIVEAGFPGVSVAAEEKKMGIKASSTRMLILEDAKVPVENVLGEIGKGHKIAFNILNIGRFKLGAGGVGGGKVALKRCAEYAIERKAFGKSISEFGLIQEKLAGMAINTFAIQSMLYRTAGLIDRVLEDVDDSDPESEMMKLKGIEEYAIECAIVKVFASEAIDRIVDEAVQLFGGYGYSKDYPIERAYRDSRINRIFEGTNEINRLLIVDMLIKRAMRGKIPLMDKAGALMNELLGPPSFDFEQDTSLLADERKIIENAKKIFMFVAGAAFQKYMEALKDEQQLIGIAADVLIDTYIMESMLMRSLKKAQTDGEEAASLMVIATQAYCHDAIERIQANAKKALGAVEAGDTLLTMLAAVRRLAKHPPVNVIQVNRQLAAKVLEKGGYPI